MSLLSNVFLGLSFLTCSILFQSNARAQCGLPINSFPYTDNFESTPGGWTPGGTGNDWAWGNPTKPTINTPASGNNCWVTGGLTGSFYNLGARSWVESPCFDFSALSHPYISFKIWWESEQRFDGAQLQYSVDGGTSWNLVGTNTNSTDCLNVNWYNTTSVTNLNGFGVPQAGWSGSIKPTAGNCLGGQGSNGWVTARQCIPYLAYKPSVQFRFAFGAGTTCNDFDGIAFDDIRIENAPAIIADFEFVCLGPDSIQFISKATNCPDSWSWGFNDPDSGLFNTSTHENPIHVFSKPGVYTVTMQASSACSPGSSTTKTLRITGLSTNSVPVDCYGNSTGSATVQVLTPTSAPTYTWNTIPSQPGSTATNLPAGIYTVTVTDPDACPATASVTITQPEPLQHNVTTTPAFCGNSTGSGSIQVSGGVGPYTYDWLPPVSTSSLAQNLPVGIYFVTIFDKNSCPDTAQIQIESALIQALVDSVEPVRCHGENNGSASILVAAGTAPYTYSWPQGIGTGPLAANLTAGIYTVTITDANACTTKLEVAITQPEPLIAKIKSRSVRCNKGSDGYIRADSTSGGTPPYRYALDQQAFGTNPYFENLIAGTHTLHIQDINGCRFSDTLELTEPSPNFLEAGPDTAIFQGTTVILTGQSSDPGRVILFQWEPASTLACDSCLNTVARPEKTTIYTLSAIDSSGCVDQAIVEVRVEPAPVYIPNAFAPASGQQNDRFTIFAGASVEIVESLQIYNRWGELLFENQNFPASDPKQGWDGFIFGEIAPVGVYIYLIRLRLIDGSKQEFSGDLLLVR